MAESFDDRPLRELFFGRESTREPFLDEETLDVRDPFDFFFFKAQDESRYVKIKLEFIVKKRAS